CVQSASRSKTARASLSAIRSSASAVRRLRGLMYEQVSMRKKTSVYVLAVLIAASSAPTLHVSASSSTVVISEFRVRGPNGGSDEFVELYNVSTAPVPIGGWKVNGSNNAGTTSTRAT